MPLRRQGPSPEQARAAAPRIHVWVWAPAFAGALVSCSPQAPLAPYAIVSNNPCIDGILAEIAAPGQIGAVSVWSQDAASASAPLAWARRLPTLGTSAEEIIAARPRLVLTGNLSSIGTNAALARAGVKTLAIGVPASVDESMQQVMQIAHAIGRDGAGDRLVARIAEATKCTVSFVALVCGGAPGPSAIIWQSGGFVPGKGTLQDELLTRAGFRNASATYGLKQWDQLPLETLLRNPPQVIFMPASAVGEDGRALAARARLLTHLKGRTRIVAFPDKLLLCGGPTIPAAMRIMRRAL